MSMQTSDFDHDARAVYRLAQAHLSAATVAELHRRRIAACTADEARRRWFGWPLATALGSACALVLALALLWPPSPPIAMPTAAIATLDATEALDTLDALDALDSIDLTALDEDSDFFIWLTTHENLLAME